MKPYLSVLALLVRSSIYKIYILFAAMAAVHTVLFPVWSIQPLTAVLLFGVEVGILLWILCRNWLDTSGHQSYTLQRLTVTPKEIFWIQASYNLLCLLLFWAVHLIVAYILYSRSLTGSQDLFLKFSGDGYLHSLMPGADWLAWAANLAILISAAVSAALYPVYQRLSMKKEGFILIAIAAYITLVFANSTNGLVMKLLFIIMSIVLPINMYRDIKRKEAETP